MKQTIITALLMCFCCIGKAFAVNDFEVDKCYYLITSDNTVAFTYSSNWDTQDYLDIPQTVTYKDKVYTVTSILKEACENSSYKRITLPPTILELGDDAFRNSKNLSEIELSNNIVKIGDNCFYGCASITKMVIPATVKEIGWNVFYDCTNLEELTFAKPSSLTNFNCDISNTKIKTIEIPASIIKIAQLGSSDVLESITFEENSKLESINSFAFYFLPNLTNIEFPSSLKWVDQDALTNTKWLANKPDGLVYAGNCAYTYKGDMPANTTIELKSTTTSIGVSAFYNCYNLIGINLPETFNKLGYYALADCYNLQDFNIPSSLSEVGYRALNNTPWYNAQPEGVVYAGNVVINYKGEMPLNTNLIIKDGVVSIADRAFLTQTNLQSISLPSSIKQIEDNAFIECDNLSSVIIPSNSQLEYMGANVFFDCNNLHSITLPNGLKTLNQTFCESGLKSIVIPTSVTNIERNTFTRCRQLESVVWPEACTTIDIQMFDGCSSLSSFKIPNTIKKISFGAFNNCTSLTTIEIPESVEIFNGNSFYGCTNLKKVFWNAISCIDITQVGTPPIFYAPFGGCPALTEFEFGESVKHIQYNTCADIESLQTIRINSKDISYAQLGDKVSSTAKTVIFGKSVTQVPRGLIANSIENVVFEEPSSIHTLGDQSFCMSKSLNSIKIPEGVVEIGDHAFWGCDAMTSMHLPSTIQTLGYGFLTSCDALKDIYCPIPYPLTVRYDLFTDCPLTSCILHVPYGSKILYQNATGWSKFYNIVEDLPSGIHDAELDDSQIDRIELLTIDGKYADDSAKGILIKMVHYKDGRVKSTKVIR